MGSLLVVTLSSILALTGLTTAQYGGYGGGGGGPGFGPVGGQPGPFQPPPSYSFQMGEREMQIIQFLQRVEPHVSDKCGVSGIAGYIYETNVTDANAQYSEDMSMDLSDLLKQIQDEVINNFPWWQEVQCPKLFQLMRAYRLGGPGNVPRELVEETVKMGDKMSGAYAEAKVCDYENPSKCDLALEPELVEIMAQEKDYDVLAYYWTAWHDAMERAVPAQFYADYISHSNQQSQANGYADAGAETGDAYHDWSSTWTFENLKQDTRRAWEALKPAYMKLHAYVRMKMRSWFGPKVVHPYGYMPMHIFGDMWAQEWFAIENITKPFPNLPSVDATNAMKAAGFTIERMFQEADKFYQQLGLPPMTRKFWEESIVSKPMDREMLCHPSAYEACERIPGGDGGDYRIKMCSEVDQKNFATVHHEMGHIQYYMNYAHQPWPFRDGANPGFHESIGDAIALSVTTPRHFQCELGLELGLGIDCNSNIIGPPSDLDLNRLYYGALMNFPMLPFAYSMENWKWDVTAGKIQLQDYNDHWYDLRRENQGLIPPEDRPDGGFDPAGKYHIVSDTEYIRYFWSQIFIFQFYQAMCEAAGEFVPNNPNSKPLYDCDFSGSRVAGKKLQKILSIGASQPWPDVLEQFTGARTLDPMPMLNYFKPILDWLTQQLDEAGEIPCFGPECGW